MKKTIFLLIIFSLALSVAGFSQKSRVGLSGGVTISNMNSRVNGTKQTENSLTGFMASMLIETPLATHISFQPHLAYVRKGMRVNQSVPNPSSDTTIQLRYFDIPLNVLFTTGKKMTFYIGGGPCFSFGLPSRRVVETGGIKVGSELTFGSEPSNNYKGFDFGVNGLVGIRLSKGFFLSVNYTQGFRNLMPVEMGDDRIRNNYAGIQLGYLFSNNTSK
jgi:hypothetical protein